MEPVLEILWGLMKKRRPRPVAHAVKLELAAAKKVEMQFNWAFFAGFCLNSSPVLQCFDLRTCA